MLKTDEQRIKIFARDIQKMSLKELEKLCKANLSIQNERAALIDVVIDYAGFNKLEGIIGKEIVDSIRASHYCGNLDEWATVDK